MKKLLLSLMLMASIQTYSQGEIITTKLALDEISKSLTQTIDEAMNRADYTVAKAAIQALSVLDAWKETNSELLDKAFTEIDAASRNLFSRMETLSNEINSGFEQHLANANELAIKTNQISESLPLAGDRSFILDYSPKVIYPTNNDEILITIKGVNLDKAEPRFKMKNGTYFDVDILGPTTASFKIPMADITFDAEKPKRFEIELEHETRDGSYLWIIPKYKDVKRKLLVSCLPFESGSFELIGNRNFKTEERQSYRANAGRFEATNSNVFKIASPLQGYKWDLRKGEESRGEFKVVTTGGGEKGRCQIINWNDSNEHGISIQARCDQIRQVRFPDVRYRAGYIHCGVEGPVYRILDATEPFPKIKGSIKWDIDQSIEIPNDLASFQLKVKLFDGKERIITNDYSDGVLKVIKNNGNIVIRSLPPTGI